MTSERRFSAVALVGIAILAAACAGHMDGGMSAGPARQTLYDRLGQKPAITAVVDDFVANVAADDRINRRFARTDIPRLKSRLVDQVCAASGGPCTYTGRSRLDAHRGMQITDAEFNALVEDLVKSLDEFKVPAREQKELLAALGGMKGDIVGR